MHFRAGLTGCCDGFYRLDAQLTEIQARMAGASRGVDSRSFGMAHVNKKNALRNMENALRNVTSRPEGSRALTAEGGDPFSRRQTRPMNYWSTKRKTDEGKQPAVGNS